MVVNNAPNLRSPDCGAAETEEGHEVCYGAPRWGIAVCCGRADVHARGPGRASAGGCFELVGAQSAPLDAADSDAR
jgi:hypothetical protein